MSNRWIPVSVSQGLAVLALAAVIAGCAEEDSQAPTGHEPETSDASLTTAEAAAETLAVAAHGDGPIGLTTTEFDGETQPTPGRLIVGPGGCLSLKDQGRPQVLVFPEDAEFVLRGDRPSVTTGSMGELPVGEPVDLDTATASLDDAAGIPDRCTQGADETVRVVLG